MLDDLLWLGGLWWGWLLAWGWMGRLLARGWWGLLDVGGELHGLQVHRPGWWLVLLLGWWLGLGWWGRWRLLLELLLLHGGMGRGWQGRRGLGLHLHGRE
jgi:hypothetical protein